MPGDREEMSKDETSANTEDATLREGVEARLFLLRLSDKLRLLDDPIAIQQTACTMLGEHLAINRVMFAEVEGDEFIPGPTYVQGVQPLPPTRTPLNAYGAEVMKAAQRGETIVYDDVRQDPRLGPVECSRFVAGQILAYIAVMLIKRDRLVGGFGIHSASARKWSQTEIELAREVADRLWEAVERARAENALRRSEEQLRHAVTLRDEFLAVLSHELRTPLSAILIWSKMLRAGAVKAEDRSQALAVIEQSAIAQRKLIEDLLDVSGMISGKVRMQMENAEIGDVLAAAVEAVHPMSEAKRVSLTLDLGESPLFGRIDRARLQQVVWNLVHNAVKFTPSGGSVRLRLKRANGNVRIEVQDTGLGIAPAFLPYVFDRFRQADSSTTRTYGGLGLGLAIARQLVELHGGTIQAKSEGHDRGATFIVEIPRTEGETSALGARATDVHAAAIPDSFVPVPVLDGVRILFVEDEAHTRTVVQWLLEQCGAEVTPAATADDALATLRAENTRHDIAERATAAEESGIGPREQLFDVLVSDVGLPEKDGYTLLAEIRKNAAGRRLPALALTAYARDDDRQRALGAGFEAFLTKPVEPRALVETIAELVRR